MHTVPTTPLSDENIAQFNMPSIESQLPIIFSNGAKIENFEGKCSQCGASLAMGHLHGSVVMYNNNAMADVSAVGVCQPCKLMVPFRYRIYQDMRFVGLNKDGVWSEWKMKPTVMGKCTKFIRWLFTW